MPVPFAFRLRRRLDVPLPKPGWPAAIRRSAFDPDLHAAGIHDLLARSYANGGGSVADFPIWRAKLLQDSEYEPDLCFLACDDDGAVIGVAQCWSSAFIKDLAVDAAWRRRGLGRALLLEAFQVFRARGAPAVELKVEADNATALAFYRRCGMQVVEELA